MVDSGCKKIQVKKKRRRSDGERRRKNMVQLIFHIYKYLRIKL